MEGYDETPSICAEVVSMGMWLYLDDAQFNN